MPGTEQNIIVLESDDDEEPSADKDDVVFVDMTPVKSRQGRNKLVSRPISIDSDDDDDDIIFVSATSGKRKARNRNATLPETSNLATVADQDLLGAYESISDRTPLTSTQDVPQDLLASSDTERSPPVVITPKLPPAPPSFHDSATFVDDTADNPTTVVPRITPTTVQDNDVTDSSILDPVTSTLSAFLTDNTAPPPVDHVPNKNPWEDTSSDRQGLLALLRDFSVPSDLGLTGNSQTPNKSTAGEESGTAVTGTAVSSSTNPLSVQPSTYEKVDSWLSSITSPSLPLGSRSGEKKKTESAYTGPSGPDIDSLLSSNIPATSTSQDILHPMVNSATSSNTFASLIKSYLCESVSSAKKKTPTPPGIPPEATLLTVDKQTTINAPSTPTTGTSPSALFSVTISPSTSSSSTSVQCSGTTSPTSSPARISVPTLDTSFSSARSSPLPSPIINLTGDTSDTNPLPLSRSVSSSNVNIKKDASPVAVTPIVISPQDDDDDNDVLPPVKFLSASSTSQTSASMTVIGNSTSAGNSNNGNNADCAITSVAKSTGASPSSSTGATDVNCGRSGGASSNNNNKRSISYMQTHPNSIPLKKRRRQRPVRQSLDIANSRDSGSGAVSSGESTDNRKCSWCHMIVSYNNLSHCMQGHPCCADCLQQRAKALLSKSKRGSLKCPDAACVSYFPMSQLQRTLPPMVVEILEEKLDQEYIKYADDLIWQNIGEGADGEGALADDEEDGEDDLPDLDATEHEEANIPKQPSFPQLPVIWEPMEDVTCGYKAVELSTENDEYKDISCLFNKTMKNQATIQRITRIQNPILWQFYNVKKLQLQEAGVEPIQEKQLCHGTSNNVVDAICKNNFDWRLCGAHGTMYGQGTYFARDASYSHVYTDNVKTRAMNNPHNILAMLQNRKKPRTHICLKHLGTGQQNSASSNNAWPGSMLNLPQPPPAHWKHQPQVSVSILSVGQGGVTTHASTSQSLLTPHVSSTSGTQNQQAGVAPGVLAPTIGATSSGNSGLNLSMRPLPLSSSLHKAFSHHHALNYPILPLAPPPAHIRRSHHPTGLGSTGPVFNHGGYPRGTYGHSKRHRSHQQSSSSTSEGSSSSQKRTVHSMFIAKVLVGQYTNGHNHYRKPPPVDHNDPYGKAYDSCVDDVRDPKIYVIFDSAQCYPEYLIQYTTNASYM